MEEEVIFVSMFTLPELTFSPEAFGDFLSAETFAFHYGKHHAGYVTKLNAAIEGTAYADQDLEEVIRVARSQGDTAVFNLAAQHANHAFFWTCLSPVTQGPDAEFEARCVRDFGSLEAMQQQFNQVAAGLFGSGWVWLVQDAAGTLQIRPYQDAHTPIASEEVTPLLTLDVWEHAYYIDYRNNRVGFIEGFWSHVDWSAVQSRVR